MARPKQVALIPPPFPPAKAIPILENLISQSDAVLKETSDPVRQQWAHSGKGALVAAIASQHPNVEDFTTVQESGFYFSGMTDAAIREQNDDKIRQMVALLKSTVRTVALAVARPDAGVLARWFGT
jgi:hypothetical protein